MREASGKELTLRDVLGIIFRHKLVIIISFLTIMISVYIAMDLRTPQYRSAVKILVSGKMQKDVEVERNLGPGSLVETQMQMVMSRPILELTVEALKLYLRPPDYEKRFATRLKAILIENSTREIKSKFEMMSPEQKKKAFFYDAVAELAGKIQTMPIGKQSSMFLISVTDFDPVMAGKIANVLGRSYMIFDLEQQIAELQLIYGEKNETIQKLKYDISEIKNTLDGRILPDIEALGPASVKIIAQAGPGAIVPMRPTKNSALIAAFIMSIVVGFVLAFTFDYIDQTIKSPHDIERFLNIDYLGSIPKRKTGEQLVTKHVNPASKYTLSCQVLSNRLYLSLKDRNLKSVLLTYVEESEESIASIAGLAICMSYNTGYNVLLIDADFRASFLHRIFSVDQTKGLADVLEEKTSFESVIQRVGSNLFVLPSGRTELDPSALLGSSRMLNMMDKIKGLFDVIIISCSNIRNYSDAIALLSCTDSVALIINEGKVKRQVVKNAIAPFEQRKATIIGGVLNNHNYVIPEIIYRFT